MLLWFMDVYGRYGLHSPVSPKKHHGHHGHGPWADTPRHLVGFPVDSQQQPSASIASHDGKPSGWVAMELGTPSDGQVSKAHETLWVNYDNSENYVRS